MTALLCAAGTSYGLVLTEKSEEQQMRAEIGKQLNKLAGCYGKAWMKCEKGTDPFTQSCVVATGVAMSPGDSTGTFAADVAKCDSKVDFLKKAVTFDATTGYQAMGCPGDSDQGTLGDQPFADMPAYQAGSTSAIKTAVDQFGLIAAVSDCDPMDPLAAKCVDNVIKTFSKLTASIGKCAAKCENDYSGTKGNGGPNDDDNCSVAQYATTAPTPDPAMTACDQKALAKLTQLYPGGLPMLIGTLVMPAVIDQLNAGNDSFYNVPGNCP